MALEKFSVATKEGSSPKCACAVIKRGINIAARAVGVAALVSTAGVIGGVPRKKVTCGGCGRGA